MLDGKRQWKRSSPSKQHANSREDDNPCNAGSVSCCLTNFMNFASTTYQTS